MQGPDKNMPELQGVLQKLLLSYFTSIFTFLKIVAG
jgi:hypothetical protein